MGRGWRSFELKFIESLTEADFRKENLPELYRKVLNQNFPLGGGYRIWLGICYITKIQLYLKVNRPEIWVAWLKENGDYEGILLLSDRENKNWNPERIKEIVANFFFINLELSRDIAIGLVENAYIEVER